MLKKIVSFLLACFNPIFILRKRPKQITKMPKPHDHSTEKSGFKYMAGINLFLVGDRENECVNRGGTREKLSVLNC